MSATWVAPAEFNIYAAAESGAALAALFADTEPGDALTIDLGQVGEIDAAGLQLLLSTALAGRREGRSVLFGDVPDVIRERFGQFGIGSFLDTCESGAASGEDA